MGLADPKPVTARVKVPDRNGRAITLHDLSTHRSGLPRMPSNFDPKDPANPYVDYPVERLYEFLSGYVLQRDIDAVWDYSNLGAGLLGHALALRAGTDYESALQTRLFRPLGMTSTAISLTPALQSRLATPHSSAFRLSPAPAWDFTDAFAGAGALKSTANDLLTFLTAVLGYAKSSLAPAMARMVTVRPRPSTDAFAMGLGWRMEFQKERSRYLIWTGGATVARASTTSAAGS
jgi:CubicO group peptidase (beta-lactamase class C family)